MGPDGVRNRDSGVPTSSAQSYLGLVEGRMVIATILVSLDHTISRFLDLWAVIVMERGH